MEHLLSTRTTFTSVAKEAQCRYYPRLAHFNEDQMTRADRLIQGYIKEYINVLEWMAVIGCLGQLQQDFIQETQKDILTTSTFEIAAWYNTKHLANLQFTHIPKIGARECNVQTTVDAGNKDKSKKKCKYDGTGESAPTKAPRLCHNCSEPGHIAVNCLKKIESSKPTVSSGRGRGFTRSQGGSHGQGPPVARGSSSATKQCMALVNVNITGDLAGHSVANILTFFHPKKKSVKFNANRH